MLHMDMAGKLFHEKKKFGKCLEDIAFHKSMQRTEISSI